MVPAWLGVICVAWGERYDDALRSWYSLRIRLVLRATYSLIDANGRKSFIMKERHLYRRLIKSGAQLPRLSSRHVRSGSWLRYESEEPLFEELQVRGAFNIKVLQSVRTIECPVDDKALWDILRLEKRGIWQPRRMEQGAIVESGWTLDDGAFLESVDTEMYRGKIANSRDMETR